MNDPIPGPAGAMNTLRTQMQAQRAAAIAAFRDTLRPDPLLAELRRVVDHALVELLQIHPLPPGAALAAQITGGSLADPVARLGRERDGVAHAVFLRNG